MITKEITQNLSRCFSIIINRTDDYNNNNNKKEQYYKVNFDKLLIDNV